MLDVRADGCVWEVSGSLDADGGARFLAAVRRADGDVRVDGSRLQRLDGAGLTALVVARRECRERGRELVVVSVAPEALSRLRARHQLPGLFASGHAATGGRADEGAVDVENPDEVPAGTTRAGSRAPRRSLFTRSRRPSPSAGPAAQEADHG